jgi:hypothetical protein
LPVTAVHVLERQPQLGAVAAHGLDLLVGPVAVQRAQSRRGTEQGAGLAARHPLDLGHLDAGPGLEVEVVGLPVEQRDHGVTERPDRLQRPRMS